MPKVTSSGKLIFFHIDAGYLPMQYLADSGNSRYFDGRVCMDMSDYASSKLLAT